MTKLFLDEESRNMYEQVCQLIRTSVDADCQTSNCRTVIIHINENDMMSVTGLNASKMDIMSMMSYATESFAAQIKAVIEKAVTDPTVN